MNSVERNMYDEAERAYKDLGKIAYEDETYANTANALNGIVDRLNKSEELKIKSRELDIKERELDIKYHEINQNKKSDKIKIGLNVALLVGSAALMVWQTKDAQRFELCGGTHTTEAGRKAERGLLGLLDKFKTF